MDSNTNIIPEEQVTKNVSDDVSVSESPEQIHALPDMKQVQALVKQIKEMLNFQESIWHQIEDEFAVNSNEMKLIVDYNENNRIVPETINIDNPDSYPEDFDALNGIDNISEEKLIEIFGEDAKIFGVDHSQTIDRIKWAAQTFYSYIRALFDFNNISKDYANMIEEQERIGIESMRIAIAQEEDIEKKNVMQKQLDDHFYFKQLDFLKEVVDDKMAGHIINTFNDGRKTQYIINKTQDALKRIGISEKFILEIAQFEKLNLDEKYHNQSNLLLMYFMNLVAFNDLDLKNNLAKRKVLAMVVGIDKYIRKGLSEEDSNIILQNILALEDQFIGKIIISNKELSAQI